MKSIWTILGILVFATQVSCNDSKNVNKDNTSLENTSNYYADIGDWKVPQAVFSDEKIKHMARPSIQLIEDEQAVLYSTDKQIELKYKGKTIVIDSEPSTLVWLFTDKTKKHIYTLWWKKLEDGKKIFFRSSSDQGKTFSEKVVINTNGGVLQQIDFYSHGDGNLAMVFYDERVPPYRVYANYSKDNGKTWGKKDIRLDNDKNAIIKKGKNGEDVPVNFALNPKLAYLDTGKLVAVWQHRKIIDKKLESQLVSRVSSDFGKTWGEEKKIFAWEQGHIVEAAIASKGNKVVVVAGYPKVGLLGFYGVDSGTSGVGWTELGGVKGTQNVNEISWLRPVLSDDQFKVGYIIQHDQNKKYQIHIATMSLDKAKWEEKTFRMDRDKKQPVQTKASYFDLKTLPNGEFVIAWQDFRSIIPMLMFDYTKNKGKNWLDHSIELTRPGLSQIRFPELYIGNNKIRLYFEWDILRDSKLPRYSSLSFDLNSTTGQPVVVGRPVGKQYTKDELIEKLGQRVTEMMNYRVKGEWEKTWKFMDPVYQQVTKKRSWLKNMGSVNFEKFDIKKLDVDGRFATAEVDMTISVAQQIRSDELMEPSPPKLTPTTMKWMWFYDDWYFFSSGSFIRYLKY